jgi:hypothetical protein
MIAPAIMLAIVELDNRFLMVPTPPLCVELLAETGVPIRPSTPFPEAGKKRVRIVTSEY